jgi:hypothetical protein
MKNHIAADGRFRFGQAQKTATAESIEKKYAAELAKADPARKLQIRKQMVEEFLRLKKIKAHKPSPGTLW